MLGEDFKKGLILRGHFYKEEHWLHFLKCNPEPYLSLKIVCSSCNRSSLVQVIKKLCQTWEVPHLIISVVNEQVLCKTDI